MTILSSVLFIIFLFFLYLLFTAKGPKRFLDQLEESIRVLLNYGKSDGFLVVKHVSSEKFVQFAKYITKEKEGIELSFPIADWSKDYKSEFLILLKSMSIEYKIVYGSNHAVFYDVDLNKNISLAYELMFRIFTEVFKISKGDKFYEELNNISMAYIDAQKKQ